MPWTFFVGQYKTKCYQCQKTIQRIRSLLDDVNIIRKNEVLAVCDHCKRSNFKNKCKRCEFLLERFISCSTEKQANLKDEYRSWWCSVKDTLLTILDVKKTCPHRVCFVQNSDIELKNLIDLLKSPSPTIRPCFDTFPNKEVESSVPIDEDTKKVLLGVIDDLCLDNVPCLSKGSSFSEASTCMCRYFDDRKKTDPQQMQPKMSLEMPAIQESHSEKEIRSSQHHTPELTKRLPGIVAEGKKSSELFKTAGGRIKESAGREKRSGDRRKIESRKSKVKNDESNKGLLTEDQTENKSGKRPTKNVPETKIKLDPGEELMLRLIKEHKRENQGKGRTKSAVQILKNMPKFDDLPELPVRSTATVMSESGSTLVCTPPNTLPQVMIRGVHTVPLDRHTKSKTPVKLEPLLFRRQFDTNASLSPSTKCLDSSKTEVHEHKQHSKGIIKYALSNKEFIDKGWTKLPTTRVMRKMNVYKVEPANPQFDWFKTHSHERVIYYDTGEMLAEINEDGCGGKWFYKNGDVALDFYNSQDVNNKQRYIIYECKDSGDSYVIRKPITILSCFDYLGNGIVYDHAGKVRLKYNQSEGIIIDKNIGTPSKWKWHTLNDPPVLQNVYVDNYVKSDVVMKNFIKHDDDVKEDPVKTIDEKMLAVEFDNFVKYRTTKLMQKLTPFKIKFKAVKINDYFSLRIIDQANVYVIFRCGHAALKLNIGMRLKSDEIIDTVTAEMAEVSTPYDVDFPNTRSLCNIQEILDATRMFYKTKQR
ncbi:unnamed protein product [Leptosia nina]|uniref:FAM194 C-terminal domain-containing protein n=1 Tax=Leptosia nina TaxID=320188 RepID=A0AAV1JZC0_9NEOP